MHVVGGPVRMLAEQRRPVVVVFVRVDGNVLLKTLVLPPAAPLLIALVGLALLDRSRRLGRLLATVGVLLLVLVSLPAVADLLVRFVDDSPPFDAAQAKAAQAIVDLSRGKWPAEKIVNPEVRAKFKW